MPEKKTLTVTLSEPVEIGGQQMTEITVRPSNIGDEEDAMQQAVSLKRPKNPLTVEMCILSRVTRIPYDKLRKMNNRDYAALRSALNELTGIGTGDAEDENPMMLE